MSAAADGDSNAGWISFGTAPENGAEFPPSGAQGRAIVVWDGGNKLQKNAAAGKSGAKITVQGTKVAEVTIEMSWPDRDPHADLWEMSLALISPYGANGQKAWDVSERYAVLYGAQAVIVEKYKGPVRKPGTDEMTMTVTCSAWTAPDNSGAGAGATPAVPVEYSAANVGAQYYSGGVGAVYSSGPQKNPASPKVAP